MPGLCILEKCADQISARRRLRGIRTTVQRSCLGCCCRPPDCDGGTMFLSLLEARSAYGTHECSICLRLEQEEVLRTQELIAAFGRRSVLDWMKKQGVLCLPHGLRMRAQAPVSIRALIDQVLERRASELRSALTYLVDEEAPGDSQHSGVLGRVAEFLAAQRGISLACHSE